MAKSSHLLSSDIQLTPEELAPVAAFQREWNSGVLVIMYADMEESISRAKLQGASYFEEVRQWRDHMIAAIVTRSGRGRVAKTVGDSLMCVFVAPSDAVDSALEIQKVCYDSNASRGAGDPISVRIGLHMGQVVASHVSQEDVFGRHLNRARRVGALALPGQVLVTYSVYDSARGLQPDARARWSDHGGYLLSGAQEPEAIYEVSLDGVWQPRTPPTGPLASRPSITLPTLPSPPPARRSRRKVLGVLAGVIVLSLVGLYVWDQIGGSESGPTPDSPLEHADLERYEEVLRSRKDRIGQLLVENTHSGTYTSCEISPLKLEDDNLTASTRITATRKGTGGIRSHTTVFILKLVKGGVSQLEIEKDDTGLAFSISSRNRRKAESALRAEFKSPN